MKIKLDQNMPITFITSIFPIPNQLQLNALKSGYNCLYVPFDLVNISECKNTIGNKRLTQTYSFGHSLCAARHGKFIANRSTNFKKHGNVWF